MQGTTTQTGRLGFGTSSLAGRIGRKESLRLLEVAYDAGIRYFDTAPMYGYGAAEGVLGEFLKTRREGVTIATKFGIEPPRRSPVMTLMKTVAKGVVSVAPSLRARFAQRAMQMVSHGNFTIPYAQMSLERSLSALEVASIDILLMHEIVLEQISPELVEFLNGAVSRGQIGRYGPATTSDAMLRILHKGHVPGTVAQFPDKILAAAQSMLPGDSLCVTHSVLSDAFKAFSLTLSQDEKIARACSDKLGFSCNETRKLGRLFLFDALQRNGSGVVVFSSLNDASIRQSAAMLRDEEFSAAQVDSLHRLLAEYAPGSGEHVAAGLHS